MGWHTSRPSYPGLCLRPLSNKLHDAIDIIEFRVKLSQMRGIESICKYALL